MACVPSMSRASRSQLFRWLTTLSDLAGGAVCNFEGTGRSLATERSNDTLRDGAANDSCQSCLRVRVERYACMQKAKVV